MKELTNEIKDKIKEMVKEDTKHLTLTDNAIAFLEQSYAKKYINEELEINLGE